jgi:hypothetical protein
MLAGCSAEIDIPLENTRALQIHIVDRTEIKKLNKALWGGILIRGAEWEASREEDFFEDQ